MRSDKDYHKDEKIEKNLRKVDKEILLVDRKIKKARRLETLSLRERLLNKV
jgi:hypothetical protein